MLGTIFSGVFLPLSFIACDTKSRSSAEWIFGRIRVPTAGEDTCGKMGKEGASKKLRTGQIQLQIYPLGKMES